MPQFSTSSNLGLDIPSYEKYFDKWLPVSYVGNLKGYSFKKADPMLYAKVKKLLE